MEELKPRRGLFLVVLAAAAVVVAVVVSGAAAAVQSPAGCNADNSVVNIARSQIAAVAGETVTFTVSSGNETSADGCDITGRSITLTLPNGTSQVFGPFNEPNGTPITVRGQLPYVANVADLVPVGGQEVWPAVATWTGTQLDGFDSDSTGSKGTAVIQQVPATTLTAAASNATTAHAGAVVTVTVTEKNSGLVALHDVTVTGAPCGSWTPVGVFNGNLAINASQDFSCQVTVGAAGSDTAWSADGHGLDTQNNQVPNTNEHAQGSIHAINPQTALTVVGTPPASVHAGDSVTITVMETNTGDDTLSNVNVTGGPCPTWASVGAFNGTLAPLQSQNFSCTFTVNGTVNWFADGHGTDSLGTAAPATGEHQAGSVHSINPQTSLTVVGTPPTQVEQGTQVTITVTETNTGTDTLSGVHVTGSPCATWDPAGPFTLAPGASQNFTCTFTVNAATVNWSADGQATDSLGSPAPSAGEHQQGSVQPITRGGLITHTNVDCGDVLSGNASNFLIGGMNYPNSHGKIGQGIDPGKFFYWVKITTTTPNQVVTVSQSNTSTNNFPSIKIHQDWQRVYTGNCASFKTGTQIAGGAGASFTIATPGSYIIGVKYDPKSLVGANVPVPPVITFTFTTSLGASTSATVQLLPK